MIFHKLLFVFPILLLVFGLYAVVAKKNVIKIIVGLLICHYSVNLFLILLGYRMEGKPPILTLNASEQELVNNMVDPVPQALILTSIVIGLGITALMIALALRIYEKYGTFDITKINKLKG